MKQQQREVSGAWLERLERAELRLHVSGGREQDKYECAVGRGQQGRRTTLEAVVMTRLGLRVPKRYAWW